MPPPGRVGEQLEVAVGAEIAALLGAPGRLLAEPVDKARKPLIIADVAGRGIESRRDNGGSTRVYPVRDPRTRRIHPGSAARHCLEKLSFQHFAVCQKEGCQGDQQETE